MAQYGINFNGIAIPDGLKQRFAGRLNSRLNPVSATAGCTWLLAGIATTPEDRDWMLAQANNGHRKLMVVTRKTAGAPVFGIYVS